MRLCRNQNSSLHRSHLSNYTHSPIICFVIMEFKSFTFASKEVMFSLWKWRRFRLDAEKKKQGGANWFSKICSLLTVVSFTLGDAVGPSGSIVAFLSYLNNLCAIPTIFSYMFAEILGKHLWHDSKTTARTRIQQFIALEVESLRLQRV